MTKFITAMALSAMLIAGIYHVEWVTVSSEEGKFTAEMPMQPIPQKQEIPSEIGDMTMNMYMADVSALGGDNMLMGIIYIDYPESLLDSVSTPEKLEAFFAQSRDGAVANMGGSLVSEKKLEIDGNQGMEYNISIMEDSFLARMQYYLVGTRGYILQVISKKGTEDNEDAKRFLTSFKLTKTDK